MAKKSKLRMRPAVDRTRLQKYKDLKLRSSGGSFTKEDTEAWLEWQQKQEQAKRHSG